MTTHNNHGNQLYLLNAISNNFPRLECFADFRVVCCTYVHVSTLKVRLLGILFNIWLPKLRSACIKFVMGHPSYHNRKFPLYVFVWSREGKTNLISALFSFCFSGIKTKFRRAKIRPDLSLRKTERFFLARFYLRNWMLSREKKKEWNKKSWCLLVYVVKWLM